MAKERPRVDRGRRQIPLRDLLVINQSMVELHELLLRLELNETATEAFLQNVSLQLDQIDNFVRLLTHRLEMFLTSAPDPPTDRPPPPRA